MKVVFICILLLLCVLQLQRAYRRSHNANLSPIVDDTPPNTHGKVPGSPANGLRIAKRLFEDVQVYRENHGGQYPPNASAFLMDRVTNLKKYGYATITAAQLAYMNLDGQYADDPLARANPSRYESFLILKNRVDGSPLGSSKPKGTRDVIAYSDFYYHENINRIGPHHDQISPVGFYIVVWDDGHISSIPYKDVSYVRGPDGFVVVFPHQAGVPSDAIPYTRYYAKLLRI